MKRYLLFAYERYCSIGGWGDFKGAFDTVAEAQTQFGEIPYCEYYQIVDTATMKVLQSNDGTKLL